MQMKAVCIFMVAIFAVFLFAISAQAQATRTWISGVGDDVNPCSRTAPCKTFAGAISKTAAGGEINCLDPGGFGAVTITKSITLDCSATHGSILASGTTGIIVNAPNAVINVRGLSINGTVNGTTAGVNGIRIMDARRVTVENTVIDGFAQNGILADAASSTSVVVRASSLRNNTGNGISSTPAIASDITVMNSLISGNGTGLRAGPNATIRITGNAIVYNGTGIQVLTRGQVISFKDNSIDANTTNGSPTSSVILQ